MEENKGPEKSPNVIQGAINYEIEFSDKEYKVKFDRGAGPELAALMVARENVKYAKANLITSVKQLKGTKQKENKRMIPVYNDRLGKVTSCEYILGMMIEQMIGEILIEKELSAESQDKMAENLLVNENTGDLAKDNE